MGFGEKLKASLALGSVVFLSACASNQQPLTPGEQAARQASVLEFTVRQCASVLGGSGVAELTRASIALQSKAASLGVRRDFSSPDPTIALAWSVSVGMQGRAATCNQFVSDSYKIIEGADHD